MSGRGYVTSVSVHLLLDTVKKERERVLFAMKWNGVITICCLITAALLWEPDPVDGAVATTQYSLVIDTRDDPDPRGTLDRIAQILQESGVGSIDSFDHGRVSPNLHAIVGQPVLSTLYKAGVRFHAVRTTGKSVRGELQHRDSMAPLPSPLEKPGTRESDAEFPVPWMDPAQWNVSTVPPRPPPQTKQNPNSQASNLSAPPLGSDRAPSSVVKPALTPAAPTASGKEQAKANAVHNARAAGQHYLPIDKARYHSNQEVEHILRALVHRCPHIMALRNIGRSVRGNAIWAMRVSDNIRLNEVGEPELLMVANLHGDEPVGRELLLWTLEHICDSYMSTPPAIKNLVDSVDLWVIPCANPDGYASMTHFNAMRVDLDRNFPDRLEGDPLDVQPETESLMDFMQSHTFAASLAFHGGSMVVSYPWDGNDLHQSGVYTAAPDDKLFRALAWSYASHNPQMAGSTEFPNGITNGARWYVLYGGMQDWVYDGRGTLQLTVELSTPKWPHGGNLPMYWQNNRVPIFSWITYTLRGVWGQIKDSRGGPVRGAEVIAFDRSGTHPKRLATIYVDPEHGDYYRILLPGSYSMEIIARGYHSLAVPVFHVTDGPAARRDFVLHLNHGRGATVPSRRTHRLRGREVA